ncbi:hypothetical protein [Sphingomonas sp.]|uniref:hypothetical protein n=1 Tax=Sphingomonas sp. TaxID=28214 RepID=UPI000DBC4472|nr:hypothetical protein [Sphingomonas sp.]PZT91991.1 MAG: hypothetical protein DI625_14760 [Sphingomonas sp.]
MKDLTTTLKYLARRFNGRWSAIDDALARIRANDGDQRGTAGEPARRMLVNAFRVQTYVDDTRDRLRTDRANAIRKLEKPLAEALGHIVTIELAEQMIAEVDAAERRRWQEQGAAERQEADSTEYGPLIAALRRHGVSRGNYTVLTAVEIEAIARYIRRKVEQRLGSLPPIRTAADMRSPGGKRHPFWNPFRMPVRDKAS